MYLIKGLVYVTFLSVRGRNRNPGWKLSGKQLAWKPTYQHWNWPAMRTPNLTAALGHVTCSGFRWHPWWWVSLLSLQGTDMETVVQHSSEMCIPKHLSCHKDLDPFSELMKWLKEVDHTVFQELCQVLIQYSYPQIPLQPPTRLQQIARVHALEYAARTGQAFWGPGYPRHGRAYVFSQIT